MLNLFLRIEMNKIQVTLTLIVISIFLSANVFADKNIRSPKAKERMDVIKKMKMLEAMDLDETKSEKFLIKLNAFNKQIDEKRKQQREVVDKLNEAVKNNAKDITNLNEQLLNLHSEIHKLNADKNQELRVILSEVEFSKYLIFENKFMAEVFNTFMNHNSDMKGKGELKMQRKTPNKKSHKRGEKTEGSYYFPDDFPDDLFEHIEQAKEQGKLLFAQMEKDMPDILEQLQKDMPDILEQVRKANKQLQRDMPDILEQVRKANKQLQKDMPDMLEQLKITTEQLQRDMPDMLERFQKDMIDGEKLRKEGEKIRKEGEKIRKEMIKEYE